MKWFSSLLMAGAALLATYGGTAVVVAQEPDLALSGCLIKLQDDVKLSAKEAGVLVHLSVKEGDQVHGDDEIARVDDDEAQMQKKISQLALSSAIKKAQDDVDVRFSEKAAAKAKADYDELMQTNQLQDRAVTESDVRQAKLEWDKMVLSIEKSQRDRELAKYEAYSKKAEVESADLAIDRRTIHAPFDGEIVTIYKDQDEWVNPGDPILRVVRLDTMLVEGAVPQSQFDPHEIQNCEVTVEVELAHGRKEQVQGRIIYVSSMVRLDGKYMVRAEVTNRKEHGRWLLQDGMTAVMTIHLNTGGEASMGVSRAP
jgi:multidrug efflux pump subunit AcrA (membrane-fusion protein)